MRFTAAACLLPLLSSASALPFFNPRQIDSELVTVIANATGLANETDTVEMVATTWYAGWHGTDFPLVNMSWDKYTHVTYAFATTTPDVSVLDLSASNEPLFRQFVAAAHLAGVKAHISIGGWSGSQYYSSNVATAENRTAFVQTVANLVSTYGVDGVDFDWEYPNKDGVGCNTRSADDSANFLAFLQELRQNPVAAPGKLTLSAATSIVPFAGNDANGTPMTNVSAFADVLDWVEVMNYDVWGSWSNAVGPNAPLNDTCIAETTSSNTVTGAGSAVSAVQAWTAAGFPSSQIVLGVPSYGHSFFVPTSSAYATTADPSSSASNVTANPLLASYPSFVAAQQPMGDAWSGAAGPDICGVQQLAGGTWDMWGLVQGGILNADGTPAAGMGYRFDTCSQTPYVYNPSTQTMISYDDPMSFKAKGEFIKQSNLRGFAMWEAGGDYKDLLLDAIREATGMDEEEESGC